MAGTDINVLFQEIKKEFEDSDKLLQAVTVEDPEIPEDSSLVQNRCDFICNDLKQLKYNIDDRLILINKHEFIMNLLNYKLYEIQYNFSKKIKKLKDIKKQLENSEINAENESKIAMKFIDNEKRITDCEMLHEDQHRSIRRQMLEAQEAYERSVNVLDEAVEVMKKNLKVLLSFVQAYKQQTSGHSNLEDILDIDEIKEAVDHCIRLQTSGWKTAPQDITEFSITHGLKFQDNGLLVTECGKEISYKEAVDLKLFDNVRFVDLFKKQLDTGHHVDQISLEQSKGSTRSTEEKMSSEDVSYLQECLGKPLTLAIAEITAVQPRDPIHYLGHWLFKYRYNEEMTEKQTMEVNELTAERERIARARWKKFVEEEARAAVINMIIRAEEEAIRNELNRMERDLQEAEEEYEEEGFYDEARDVLTPM